MMKKPPLDRLRHQFLRITQLLLDLKARGLSIPPKLAIGDGALDFWSVLEKVWPQTSQQRGWFHKSGNVLNKLPKSLQKKTTADLYDIWMPEIKEDANIAFDLFIKKYEKKYPSATSCLAKDRAELLAFYDFPAEHWKHIRTTKSY